MAGTSFETNTSTRARTHDGSASIAHPASAKPVAVSKGLATRASSVIAAWLGPYTMVALVLAIFVACNTMLRAVMLVEFVHLRTLTSAELPRVFFVGLRFDLFVGLCYCLPQVLHLTILGQQKRLSRPSWMMLETEWLVGFLLLPFFCVVEYLFFYEFESRLNYIAFEYLVYPTEVCCSIWQSYPVVQLLSVIAVIGGALWWFLRRLFNRLAARPIDASRRWGILGAWLVASTLLWSTMEPDTRQVSHDRVANECSWNGLYSFVYHAWTCHLDYDQNYLTIDDADAVQRLRSEVLSPSDQLVGESNNPVDRTVISGQPQRDHNVVLILEESFGSDFVGALGDKRGLTANFDALTREGILFDRVYATGNRTARALEAVMTSAPPIPTESILKRDHSERVYTIANVLANRGYERLFMTGGHGSFDGVHHFMTKNGFNYFVEQSEMDHDAVFENAWGVSDEDLFRHAIIQFDQLHEKGRPFFATVLTVSNHRPYTYPAGRIPEDYPDRDTAVKYADWALGQFFQEARKHAFYENTIFVVLGDHGARVYGSQFFPMSSYRVPVLMILPGGKGAGTRCSTLACSLDVSPTILAQLGGDYRSVFFGRDILQTDPKRGRAVMQHNHDIALLDANNKMVVLGYGKTMWGFQLEADDYELKQLERPDPEMMQDIAAIFQTAFELYYAERWYPDVSAQSIAETPH